MESDIKQRNDQSKIYLIKINRKMIYKTDKRYQTAIFKNL